MHVVRPGDTLWDLASFYLTDPFLWPEIYRLNTLIVEDPHWIYPDEQLLVPGPAEVGPAEIVPEVPGVPVEPGEEVTPRVEVPVVEPIEPPPEMAGMSVFAARRMDQVETLRYQPSPPTPAVTVTKGDFYRAALLTPLSDLGPRGEVIDVTAPEGGRLGPFATIPRYERVYVSHPDGEAPQPGDRIVLLRIERRIEPHGRVVRPTGIATIAAVHQDVSTAVVIDVFDQIQVGNQTVYLEMFDIVPGVFAQPVATGPSGELIALLDEQEVASIEDIAFIDVGRSQGVTVGDEFEVYLPGRRAGGGLRLPEEHIATGRVVRVTDETATLRMIEMRHPDIWDGLPARLIRKMPS